MVTANLLSDHWNTNTRDFLMPHLYAASRLVRVATGFFTVQGYDEIRPALEGKSVHILVGYDEAARERLRGKLVRDILEHLSRWEAPDRRQAVQDLVDRMERGQVRIVERETSDIIDARIRQGDHAKVYILDERVALVGSSNLTRNGLISNTEGVACVDAPERVAQWLEWFETYWKAEDTYDLTGDLLEALRRWLGLARPYDVYLKTVLALVPEEEDEPPRDSYKVPVMYQRVVVERMLRQLEAYRGAMLVASTGLGKTIMATHLAYRMQRQGKIRNVVVFAPVPVQPAWKRAMRSAGINADIFTRNLLDQPESKQRRNPAIRNILEVLGAVDDQYIIFVDESQYFSNRLRAKDGQLRHSFDRLVQVAADKKPYVVLLTATPFTKDVEDLNSQLHLLPHTAEPSYVTAKGQSVFPGIGETFGLVAPQAWRVPDKEGFFEEFLDLPVSTVISTSQVARDFAVSTDEGDYVEFSDGPRWLPRIELLKVSAPLPLEGEMSRALDGGYFRHQRRRFRNRGQWRVTENSIVDMAVVAWMSSPAALREVIRGTIEDRYKARFVKSPQERQRVLGPILEALKTMNHTQDAKFLALCDLLRRARADGRKVVLFTERYPTALYLEEKLKEEMPELRVANAVRETKLGAELKDFEKEVFDLIVDFAPEANKEHITPGRKQRHYDLLIATDAYAAGVNLQDASVAISYDLAWTPDRIIQRAGRILRFWHRPRQVALVVFVGQFERHTAGGNAASRVEKRLRQLIDRSRRAERFSQMPFLPDEDRVTYDSLSELAGASREYLGFADMTEIEEFTGVSPFLKHITELKQNLEYATALPDDICSARTWDEGHAKVYLLLRYGRAFHWILYEAGSKHLQHEQEDRLLDMLKCEPDTPVAEVDVDALEAAAQQAKRLWAEREGIADVTQVQRVCAMYLLPAAAWSPLQMIVDQYK